MRDLSFYILCLIGTIYLFWRVGAFFKTLLQLIFKSENSEGKPVEDGI